MSNEFDFWNSDKTEVEHNPQIIKAEVEEYAPQFPETVTIPDKLTKTWVQSQLPVSTWKRHKTTKCTPALISEMSRMAAKTPSKRALMARFGMPMSTWYRWERKALAGEQPYVLWHQCVMHGISQLEEELLDNIRGHAVTDWKAAAWYLARINREEYSEKQATTQISVQGDSGSKVTINRISEDDAVSIARILGEINAIPAGESGVVDGEVVGESDS